MFNRMALLLEQSPREMKLDILFTGPGIKGHCKWEVGRTKRLEVFKDADGFRDALGHVADGILLHFDLTDEKLSLNKPLQPLTSKQVVIKFRYKGTHSDVDRPYKFYDPVNEAAVDGHWWYRLFSTKRLATQWLQANDGWIEIGA